MILTQIAAMAQNRVIGRDNQLPWHLPEDLKFFRQMTQKKILIMGRKTFESLPGHLPGRFHIVISRSEILSEESDLKFVRSLDEALRLAQSMIPPWNEEVMIVGGAEIYKLSMPFTDRIYLTLIQKDFPGDTTFPLIPKEQFSLKEEKLFDGELPFKIQTFERSQLRQA